MDPRIVPLYYLSSLAGFIMVAGGIWMLYKQKIYIDRASKKVTEISTPIGTFRTNIPALALFALGFFPLVYPIVKSAGFAEEILIRGNVRASAFPVQVYAVVQSDSLLQNRDFALKVPVLRELGQEYKILYVCGSLVCEDRAELQSRTNEAIHLLPKELSPASVAEYETDLPPVPPEFH